MMSIRWSPLSLMRGPDLYGLGERSKGSRERHLSYSLSEGQRGLWLLGQIGGGSSAYNLPLCVRVRGRLEVEAVRRSLAIVVAEQPALSNVIGVQDGSPYQQSTGATAIAVIEEDSVVAVGARVSGASGTGNEGIV